MMKCEGVLMKKNFFRREKPIFAGFNECHAVSLSIHALGFVGFGHPDCRTSFQFQETQAGVVQQYGFAEDHSAGKRQDTQTEVFSHSVLAMPFHCGSGFGVCFPV